MLVLTRKVGQKILIGDNIEVIVTRVDGPDKVRLGIIAPLDIAIDREEIRILKDKNGTTV